MKPANWTSRSGAVALVDAAVFLIVCAIGIGYFGSVYRNEEANFRFYQRYFFSAVNIYCTGDPDARAINDTDLVMADRIDLARISCPDVAQSPKVPDSEYNGWHDIHPMMSTLMAHAWRLLGLEWRALWPIAGSLGGLAIAAYYLILRGFGVPWIAALLLLPGVIPYRLIQEYFFQLRDFSKVPFILLSLAMIASMFNANTRYWQRMIAIFGATSLVVIGAGFRQDAVVMLPPIAAAVLLTTDWSSRQGLQRLVIEALIAVGTFLFLTTIIGLLKTTQEAQLQGYPHFILQGFADPFWREAHSEVPGISFLSVYSDFLAWAAIDANTLAKVGYFTTFDPHNASSGIDLLIKYVRLSAGDVLGRVLSGLSAIAHNYWSISQIGTWFVLLLALVILGKWRLAAFIGITVMNFAAAGSLQFSPRHSLHLVILDRALAVIILTNIISAVWTQVQQPSKLYFGLASTAGFGAFGFAILTLFCAHLVQNAALLELKESLAKSRWYSTRAELDAAVPGRSEAIRRVTIAPAACPYLELQLTVDGERASRRLDQIGNKPRNIYLANFDPTISKVAIDLPAACVIEEAWAALGDGTIPPLQVFDPEAALANQSFRRLFTNLIGALR